MRVKIVSIILIIISLGLIVLGLIGFDSSSETRDFPKELEGYDIGDFATLSTCIDESCQYKETDLYSNMLYDYDSEVLQNAIEKLNQNTSKYYQIAKDSVIDASCSASQPTVNQHSIRVVSKYNAYSDGRVITLNIKRTKINVCTNETESYQSENYVYDMKRDKLLTLDETKEILKLTNEDIGLAIEKANKNFETMYNVSISTDYNPQDIKIYYNTAGDLYVSYYVAELKTYMSALLRDRQY